MIWLQNHWDAVSHVYSYQQGWIDYKKIVIRYNYSYFDKCSQLQLLLRVHVEICTSLLTTATVKKYSELLVASPHHPYFSVIKILVITIKYMDVAMYKNSFRGILFFMFTETKEIFINTLDWVVETFSPRNQLNLALHSFNHNQNRERNMINTCLP